MCLIIVHTGKVKRICMITYIYVTHDARRVYIYRGRLASHIKTYWRVYSISLRKQALKPTVG